MLKFEKLWLTCSLLCPRPIGWGHNALMAIVCLSVCPSVFPVPDPRWRTEGHTKLKIGRTETHDTDDRWPYLEVCGGGKIQRRTACVFYRDVSVQWVKVQWTITVIWPAAESSWWLFKSPLAGGGAFLSVPLQAAQLVAWRVVCVRMPCIRKRNTTLCQPKGMGSHGPYNNDGLLQLEAICSEFLHRCSPYKGIISSIIV